MAIDHEDFVRCQECGSADFKEEAILTIPKTLKPRESKKEPIKGAEIDYHIVCAKCNVRTYL